MGVLNCTPDSFSDGGKYTSANHAARRFHEMVQAGAGIIDIGAESTRPGSQSISPEEQIRRIQDLFLTIDTTPVPISIDTRSAEVADFALSRGAVIVNDVSMLRLDSRMAATVADHDAILILNHSRDIPASMQNEPYYHDVVDEVIRELSEGIHKAHNSGVRKIIVDPGIGFGKQISHNLEILRHLRRLNTLGCPIMIGTSRKSFIGSLASADIENRLPGTIASTLWGLSNGATLCRVHDVYEISQAITVWDAISKSAS